MGHLQQKGLATIRFHFRGVGGSTGSASWAASTEQLDVHAACDYLRETGAEAILLLGYSYGSVVASAAADERHDVLGVVAVSYPYGVLWAIAPFSGAARRSAFARARAPKLVLTGDADNFTSLSGNTRFQAQLREESERAADEYRWGENEEGSPASSIDPLMPVRARTHDLVQALAGGGRAVRREDHHHC